MNRRGILMIITFIFTCIAIEIIGINIAGIVGLSTDTSSGGGPGRAGNTPATVIIGILALIGAILAAHRVGRRT